ncbi:sodium bile acid symporter family-domain-containing protein [Baffinella frigidus]|nr:sodium bile acid symporter family-domain-containing protein [Cryptophyta sp. CCMP2293]
MSSCSRRTALGAVLLAALSLDASALHLPPGCGVEALRGGGNPFQQCFGLRMRNPFHKPQPLPPPPPPPRMRTFKDKYFKVVETLTLMFPVWTVGLSLLALWNPDRFEWLTTESATYSILGVGVEMDPFTLFLSMTMLSMGTNLTWKDFYPIRESIYPICVAFLFQYGVVPILGWIIGQFLPAPLAVGLVLLASCPGSQSSNVACFIAGGNLPVSIIMTLLSTSVSAVMTPLLVRVLAGAKLAVPGIGIMLSLLKVVIGPTLLGLLLNVYMPHVTAQIKPITPLIGVVLTSCLCAAPIAGVADLLLEQGMGLIVPVVLLHALSFFIGYTVPRYGLGMSEQYARTISIESGMQSAALGFLLARKHFSSTLTAVPSAVGVLVMSWMGALMSVAWRLKDGGVC